MTIDPRRIEVMDDKVAEIMRAKTPAERMAIAAGMWRSARRMVRAVLHHDNPHMTAAELDRAVASRMSHGAG